MKVTVKTHHVAITKALKSHAEKKLEKLFKFFNNVQSITVELNVIETADENKRQEASAIIHASGTTIKAKSTSKDMYASIDTLYDKAEVQLKKYKEKLRNHKKPGAKRDVVEPVASKPSVKGKGTKKAVNDEAKRIIRASKQKSLFVPKPLHPEDAAALLEDKALSFLVFRNSHTDAINVIYPDGKGQFALIETD